MRFGQTISPIAAPAACGSLLSLGLRAVAGATNIAVLFAVHKSNRILSHIVAQNDTVLASADLAQQAQEEGAVVGQVTVHVADPNAAGENRNSDSRSSSRSASSET